MARYTIFDPDKLYILANTHRPMLEKLGDIERKLQDRFHKMNDPIRALILAAASGEPLLFKGPPGTAKSNLVRAFCGYIGVNVDASGRASSNGSNADGEIDYFEYLLTPFTEPGELFGYFDVAKAQAGKNARLERDTSGMLQNARVVYLDEVFKGSSAILNSLLGIMQERKFHDRGKKMDVKMQCMFGATNEVPHTSELRAVFDRFVLRCEIQNFDHNERISLASDLKELINKGWKETYGSPQVIANPDLLNQLAAFRQQANTLLTQDIPLSSKDDAKTFMFEMAKKIEIVRQHDLSQMSNRRIVKFMRIMMIHAVFRSITDPKREGNQDKKINLDDNDLLVLRFMLDRRDALAEEHLGFGEHQWGMS